MSKEKTKRKQKHGMKRAIKSCMSLVLVAVMLVTLAPQVNICGVMDVKAAGTQTKTETGTRGRLLTVALQEISKSDYTRYNGHYDAWCADFVCWCMSQAGINSNLYLKSAYVPSIRDYYWGKGKLHMRSSSYIPKAGDLILYDGYGGDYNGVADHIGIVVKFDGTNITTIEGNTYAGYSAAGVHHRVIGRNNGNIYGFCQIDYPSEGTMPDINYWLNQDKSTYSSGGGSTLTATFPTRNLSQGSSGGDVKWVQEKLNYLIGSGLDTDGIFGANTRNAVRAYQSRYGLAVDGIVGPATRNSIQAEWQKRQTINVNSISISSGKVDITTGKTLNLSANISPSNATNKTVTWSSSNSGVVSVSNGKLSALKAGTATITAKSHNGKTAVCTVTVRNPIKITFVNDDEAVLSEQFVDYGGSAVAPQAPEKTGYNFNGWKGIYQNVKESAIVKASYSKKSYTVTYKETNGKLIGATQKVYYKEAAKAPDESLLSIPAGYTFAGWSEDFDVVESDMTIYPIYKWKDEELPMVVEVGDDACVANYAAEMYYLNFTIKNHSDQIKNARVMTYMITNEGMLVAQGETRTVRVPAAKKDKNGNITEDGVKQVTDMYISCSVTADKARILVLDDYESAVPLAEMVDVKVSVSGYGEWTDEKPANGTKYQTRTLYRSKNVSYTTSTSTNSISGWTLYKTNTERKKNNDSIYYGQGRSATPPKPSADYYDCWATGISYQYNPSPYLVPTYNISIDTYGGDSYRSMVKWIQTVLCRYGYGVDIDGIFGYNTSAAVKNFQRANGLEADGIVGVNTRTKMQNKLNSDPLYKYYYSTATTKNTYYFYKEDANWSDWQESAITGDTTLNKGTTTRLVQTKTQYRVKVDATEAVATGKIVRPDCVLPEEAGGLAGKDAVVIVFKNKVNQIAEDNVEYVGTTKIGTDGSLNISFIPREEQTYETGDYTIVLGVKGTSNYVKVGVMENPKPVYTVSFMDADGNKIDEQEILEGNDAKTPDAPEREGYRCIGWDMNVTNIHSDMTITAQYVPNKYNVNFVDWENRTFITKEFSYGEIIDFPEITKIPEGYELDKWTVAEGTAIKEDMLCEAVYKKKVYDVTFVNWEGNVVEKQEIEHGEAAMSPGITAKDEEPRENTVPEVYKEMNFVSWGEGIDLSCITGNLVVGAKYEFSETVQTPVASVEAGEYDKAQLVALTSETPDAVIYYTLDGSDPKDTKNENVNIYTNKISVKEHTKLRFYAARLGMNDSSVNEVWYAINQTGNVPSHIVTIYAVDTMGTEKGMSDFRDIVKDNTAIDISELLNIQYDTVELEGIYYDAEFTDKWQAELEMVTESLTLYAKYGPKKFNVTYLDDDGAIIKIDKVEYGMPADAEIASEKDGYKFAGWESEDDAECITKEITVKAKYVEESRYAVIKFTRNSYSVMEDTTYRLTPKVTYELDGKDASGEALRYISSDEDIATVDENGNVSAVKKGEVTITAIVESSGERAVCKFKVTGNPDNSICLYSNSSCRLIDGYLRDIEIEKNTIADIKKQIDSERLEFYDCDNVKLKDDDRAGTNTRINLTGENGGIIDSIIVVLTGDYNGDGLLNGKDVSGIARCLLDMEEPDDAQLRAMDVNGDGVVNNRDAAMLSRYLVGKEKL